MVELDPWGSASVEDYSKLFEEFGITEFDETVFDDVEADGEAVEPLDLMRRGIIFGERDYDLVVDAMREGDDYAALSGFMPSGPLHVGHMMVFRELVWHQRQGAETYFVVADLEAHSARGVTWEECERYAVDYVASLLALGFDADEGHVYRQSENDRLRHLAFELSEKTNYNEMNAIYGFDGETNLGHVNSTLTQAADILYPQIDEPKPTVIPVGADQDPHMRLTRGLARRMRMFGVNEAYASFELDESQRTAVSEALALLGNEATAADVAGHLRESHTEDEGLLDKLDNAGDEPLEHRVRVLSRDSPREAFDEVAESLRDGYDEVEVYGEHVDVYDASVREVDEVVRDVEVEHGGYGFYPPSSIYHRFQTGLTGGKMSSSVEKSHVALTDTPEDGYDKVMSAETGGRETAELQRELGGEAEKCPVYELYAYSLAEDDEHAKRVYDECVGGERLCGECKSEAAGLMQEFLEEHAERREEHIDEARSLLG
ncbi:MAG: tryptophan--tRNA ligase [Halobacteriota archaeon]